MNCLAKRVHFKVFVKRSTVHDVHTILKVLPNVGFNFALSDTPSPARSRKSSALPKKGTLHYIKKEGREDNSTFVIREGTYQLQMLWNQCVFARLSRNFLLYLLVDIKIFITT